MLYNILHFFRQKISVLLNCTRVHFGQNVRNTPDTRRASLLVFTPISLMSSGRKRLLSRECDAPPLPWTTSIEHEGCPKTKLKMKTFFTAISSVLSTLYGLFSTICFVPVWQTSVHFKKLTGGTPEQSTLPPAAFGRGTRGGKSTLTGLYRIN